MKNYLILLTTILITTACFAQQVEVATSPKRGLAYGYHSQEDLDVLSPNVGWWYNWGVTPDTKVADNFGDHGFEFVPMTWNGGYDETKLRNYLTNHPETKYILAFNEPNFLEQANMSPAQVAAAWPKLEAIADEFNLGIVGPAVNYCGTCVKIPEEDIDGDATTYQDPIKYLDDFFKACVDCRVDHIAIHTYMNTLGALTWYVSLFEKYNKPIWLTEFAGWEENGNIKSVDDQINFMKGALNYLDNEPTIFRYAWFIGRTSGGITKYPYIDILGANGQLTKLGEVYAADPFIRDVDKVVDIPAFLFAEDYNYNEGFSFEVTADIYGLNNAGYTDIGDWLEFKINVPSDGEYDFDFRVAVNTPNATLKIIIDEEEVLTQNMTNTGGWQKWTTVSSNLNLTTGAHVVRLVAVTAGFNLNYIGIGKGDQVPPKRPITVIPDPDTVTSISDHEYDMYVYPNPSAGLFKIESIKGIAAIQVFNLSGQEMKTNFESNVLDMRHLYNGFYIIKTKNKQNEINVTRVSILK